MAEVDWESLWNESRASAQSSETETDLETEWQAQNGTRWLRDEVARVIKQPKPQTDFIAREAKRRFPVLNVSTESVDEMLSDYRDADLIVGGGGIGEEEAVARYVHPERRESVVAAVQDLASQRKTRQKRGFFAKTAELALRQTTGMLKPAVNLMTTAVGFGLDDEQEMFRRDLEAAYNTGDPLVPESDPWYKRFASQGFAMAGPMILAQTAGGALGGLARAGSVAQKALSAIGVGGAFAPVMYEDTYYSLRKEGIPETTARVTAGISAIVQAAAETIELNPILGREVKDVILKTARQKLLGFGKRFAKEWSEEYIQGITDEVAKETARWIESKTGRKGYYEALKAGAAQGLASGGPLLFMMGGPAVVRQLASLPSSPSRAQFEQAGGPQGSSIKSREETVKQAQELVAQGTADALNVAQATQSDAGGEARVEAGPVQGAVEEGGDGVRGGGQVIGEVPGQEAEEEAVSQPAVSPEKARVDAYLAKAGAIGVEDAISQMEARIASASPEEAAAIRSAWKPDDIEYARKGVREVVDRLMRAFPPQLPKIPQQAPATPTQKKPLHEQSAEEWLSDFKITSDARNNEQGRTAYRFATKELADKWAAKKGLVEGEYFLISMQNRGEPEVWGVAIKPRQLTLGDKNRSIQERYDAVMERSRIAQRDDVGKKAHDVRVRDTEDVRRDEAQAKEKAVSQPAVSPAPARVDPRGILVFRTEEKGTSTQTPEDKPHGLYVAPEGSWLEKEPFHPSIEKGDRNAYYLSPKNPLDVPDTTEQWNNQYGKLFSRDIGFIGGNYSVGIRAARILLGESEFSRLSSMDSGSLKKWIEESYPGIEWGKYYDNYERMEAVAGIEGRKRGVDAFIGTDEHVVLSNSAISPAKPAVSPAPARVMPPGFELAVRRYEETYAAADDATKRSLEHWKGEIQTALELGGNATENVLRVWGRPEDLHPLRRKKVAEVAPATPSPATPSKPLKKPKGKAKKPLKPEPPAETPLAPAARRLDELRGSKPLPLSKLYGKNGPTPEQAVAHAEQMREWNRKYRAAQKSQKQELEEANKPTALEGKAEQTAPAVEEPAKPAEQQALEAAEAAKPIVQAGPKAAIPVSKLPAGKTPSTGEVVAQLSQNFQLPIRTGHFIAKRGTAGIYKVLEEVARIKGYGNIAVAAHEVAHHVDKLTKLLRRLQKPLRAELSALDYDPTRKDIHEGFAEYVRHYLAEDDAATVAPQFDTWFRAWLGGRPDVSERFSKSKTVIDTWRNAGSLARVEAQIDMGESKLTKVVRALRKPRTLIQWVTDNWYNRLAPLLRASKQMVGAKSAGEVVDLMDPNLNFWAFAKVSNMAASAKARAWAHFGVSDVQGNILGPGLRETLAPIADDLIDQDTLKKFYSYAYARHALDVIAQGKNPGIRKDDAEFTVREYNSRPGWRAAADGITAWHSALIDYLVDAGGLSQQEADLMRGMYPHYISLARKMDSEFLEASGIGGGRYANLPSAVKRLKGSGRDILPPLESAMAYAERIIGIADKVRVGRLLVEASEKYGTLGDTVEKVAPGVLPHSATLDSLKTQLETAGADLSMADMDAILTIFSQNITGDPKDNIVILYRNGQREAYYVRDDLYRALTAYDKPYRLPEVVDQTIGRIARGIRLGATGVRAGFSLVTNPLRDMWTALMQTEYQARNPFSVTRNVVRGFVDEVTGSEVSQRWKVGGGEMAQPLGIDRAFLREAVNELLSQSPKAKMLNWAQHPIDSMRTLFSLPESAPRLAEFRAGLESLGWKPGQKVTFEQFVKAQLAAANVTVDFREGGNLAMWVNQVIPFFNATLQGPARMASAIRNNPVATITAGIMSLTLPTLALWLKNRDEEWYKELRPMEKYRYWHIRIPGTDVILRLPRPFEWGHIFASIPEAMLESFAEANPQAIHESVGVAIEDATPALIPGIAQAPIEIAANREFYFDRPLVPERMKRMLPKDQFNPYTSETAKRIGALFGISPIYVDHLASGWSGGLLTDLTKSGESLLGFATHKTASQITGGPSELPVVGRLFTSPIHTRVFDDFYSRLERLEAEHGSGIALSGELRTLRHAADQMSQLRKQSRMILDDESLTDDQKREAFMSIHQQMVRIAQSPSPKTRRRPLRKRAQLVS